VKIHSFLSIFPSVVPVAAGAKLFFRACDVIAECGLWASDGTEMGTVLLTRFPSGPMASFSGKAYFSANDGSIGNELWSSDGTVEGTGVLKDLASGPTSSGPHGFEESAGRLFFFAWTGAATALWKSDGTSAGTVIVKVGAATNGDTPQRDASGTFYFIAAPSFELWKSDGTEVGTVPIRVICSPVSSCSTVREMAALGSLVIFRGGDEASGLEPWVSNGTFAGTGILKDVDREPRSSRPSSLFDRNGTILFAAYDGAHGSEPWRSDGTKGGTELLKDIFTLFDYGSFAGGFAPIGAVALFGAMSEPEGLELWKTDGTTAGTLLVKDINPSGGSFLGELVPFGGFVYFPAFDGVHRSALWKSDGTPEGTVLVKDVGTGEDGEINDLTVANGTLFFLAAFRPSNGSLTCSLWKSDGTTKGTTLVRILNSPCNNELPRNLTSSGKLLYLSAYETGTGLELWKSDGTQAGTVRVKDIAPGTYGSDPRNLVDLNGILFFSASNGTGYELWRSDGTEAGTYLVRDILSVDAVTGSFPQFLTQVGGALFFSADDGIHGRELWRSDGTLDGTVLVRDIRTGPSGSSPQQLTNVNGTVVFAAADHPHGMELWRSDGTSGGTVMIQDIRPGPASSQPFYYPEPGYRWTVSGSRVFFTADDETTGYELWSVPVSALSRESEFYTLAPCRVADTREPTGPFGGPPLAAGSERIFPLAGRCGIPPTAKSVAINLTVVDAEAPGHLTVYPATGKLPVSSSLNYRAGQARANNAIVPLGVEGTLAVFCEQSSGTAHVVIDVAGYFE
jgi:ELWxxDGT repeat protein